MDNTKTKNKQKNNIRMEMKETKLAQYLIIFRKNTTLNKWDKTLSLIIIIPTLLYIYYTNPIKETIKFTIEYPIMSLILLEIMYRIQKQPKQQEIIGEKTKGKFD